MAYEQGMDISYVNVVVDGHEHEVQFDEIDVSEHPTSEELKGALEIHLGLANGALRNYEVDGYSATGQVVVRPDSKLGAEDEMTVRSRIMDSLLRCPHRDMPQILALHQEMMEEDPEFYAHFAVWAMKNTKVRDHKEAMIATLFASGYPEFREVAYVLMQNLPAYQVARIKEHVQGGWKRLNIHVGKKSDAATKKKAKDLTEIKKDTIKAWEEAQDPDALAAYRSGQADTLDRRDVDYEPFYARVRTLFNLPKDARMRCHFYMGRSKLRDKEGKFTGETRASRRVRFETFQSGIVRRAPRIMKSAVTSFLRVLEANEDLFDVVSVRQHEALKTLYASFRIKPSDTADQILFKVPPEGTKRAAMKKIAKMDDPVEWAKAVVAAKLPFPVAAGLLNTEMTPVHLVALINQMTAQELLNNMGALESRGALENADVKKLIEQKLGKAAKSDRVDTLKAQKALKEVGGKLGEDTSQKLRDVTDQQVARGVKIKRNTVLAIDASSSMNRAIELGKDLASLIAPACKGEFLCVSFNQMSRKHEVPKDKEGTKSAWDEALKYVMAKGRTNIGSICSMMERDGRPWEQIVLITDEGDNGTPKFSVALERYAEKTGLHPNVVIVRCKSTSGVSSDQVERGLKSKDIEVDVFDLTKTDKVDYYSLPNVLPMLAKGSQMELLMDIMDVPLPSRKEWDRAHLSA